MASLAQMKAAATSQGATAPPGYPGGPDQWVQDWYQNAVNAGSIAGERTRGELTATDATTGTTPQGYKNTGTSQFADMIRAKAKAENWSEDFERFSDAQIEAWRPSWDEQAGRFRSEGDPGQFVEKPTECGPGKTLHGSRCVSWAELPYELGGGGGMGGGGQQAAGPAGPAGPTFDPRNPLQQGLINLYQERGGQFAGHTGFGDELTGGGIFWGQSGAAAAQPAVAAAALNAFTPAAPSQQAAAALSPAPAPQPSGAQQLQQNLANTSAFGGGITGRGTGEIKTQEGNVLGAIQQPATTAKPLEAALQRQYRDPNKWWQGDANRAMTV